ncbi:hypothetical protein HKX48_005482 [Thoreauomyces humboldtii]|nr:hypothetical protein HKX48_005482 [Thoreauomyces humboldtii]
MDLATLKAALKTPDALADDAWDLFKLLDNHSNDASLKVLFHSLRASYDFLDHCCMLLERYLHQHIDMFALVRRGSLSSATALRATVDIDVDLALPRTVNIMQREYIEGEARRIHAREAEGQEPAEPDEVRMNILRADVFKSIVEELGNIIFPVDGSIPTPLVRTPPHPKTPAHASIQLSRRKGAVTRSIPCVLEIHGRNVEVDLFPKILDGDGNLVGLSKTLPGGGRMWETKPFKMDKRKNKEPERECATLLMKLWKEHGRKKAETLSGLAAATETLKAAEANFDERRKLFDGNQRMSEDGRRALFPFDRAGWDKQEYEKQLRALQTEVDLALDTQEKLSASADIKKWKLPKSYHVCNAIDKVPLAVPPPTGSDAGFRQRVLYYLHSHLDHLISAYTRPADDLESQRSIINPADLDQWSDENLRVVRQNLEELKEALKGCIPELAATH